MYAANCLFELNLVDFWPVRFACPTAYTPSSSSLLVPNLTFLVARELRPDFSTITQRLQLRSVPLSGLLGPLTADPVETPPGPPCDEDLVPASDLRDLARARDAGTDHRTVPSVRRGKISTANGLRPTANLRD